MQGHRRCGFDPWVGKMSWRREWLLTPVFLPGKCHEQKSLEGYSPWGHKRVGHDLAPNNKCLSAGVVTYNFWGAEL